MNTTTVTPSSIVDPIAALPKTNSSRCPYIYPNGKRCRLLGLPAHSGFCLGHSQANAPIPLSIHVQNDSEDLTAELLPELSEFNAASDITKFLARLLKLATKGAISPRRASVLAYITNQLLHSHRAIARDNHPQPQEDRLVFDYSGWPEPADGSGIKGPAVYRRAIEAGLVPDPRLKAAQQGARITETNVSPDRPNR